MYYIHIYTVNAQINALGVYLIFEVLGEVFNEERRLLATERLLKN